MSLQRLVSERSLIVCVGPGGVGKTTVSAALGLAGARAGRRTAVLTIDPARRLADALGLPELEDAIAVVPTHLLPGGTRGELHAAMVESAASYDALIRRIAVDDAMVARILANRVYQAVRRSIARSHAYVAMERLYDAVFNLGYDLVVLDTPPARNALDILDAPRQLARFLDAKIMNWFLPEERRRSLTDRLLAQGGEAAKKMLSLVTGQVLLDEILGFLAIFAELRQGFAERAERVDALLRTERTAFVLVSSASPASADDAAWLREDLERRNVPVNAVVFNQSYLPVYSAEPGTVVTALRTDDLDVRFARLQPHLPALPGLRRVLSDFRALRQEAALENARYQRVVDGLTAELPPACTCVRAPKLDGEIRDLPGLLRLGEFLVG